MRVAVSETDQFSKIIVCDCHAANLRKICRWIKDFSRIIVCDCHAADL